MYGSCAELRAATECDRAIVKKHCPASCGACPDSEAEVADRHRERRLVLKQCAR